MKNDASSVLFRRLPYMLSPQLDIYENLPPFIRGKNRVLEVGFGTGAGVLQYARAANHVTAIEVDPAAVRFAQQCFPLENVRWQEADIVADDLTQTIYGDFDFVVMIEVLEHIEFVNLALVNVRTLLAPGSHALIAVPNKLRDRRKKDDPDPWIIHEWDAVEFHGILLDLFDDVRFLSFELRELGGIPSIGTATPLIALCS
jgi:2-polyprenyl-3-methyl-5-hydroxy-6-metoxy-1,4-benzoquinol methylase